MVHFFQLSIQLKIGFIVIPYIIHMCKETKKKKTKIFHLCITQPEISIHCCHVNLRDQIFQALPRVKNVKDLYCGPSMRTTQVNKIFFKILFSCFTVYLCYLLYYCYCCCYFDILTVNIITINLLQVPSLSCPSLT